MLEERKAAGPDGIMNEILMYGGGRLVEVMLLVMKSACCRLDWKRSLLVTLHNDGNVEQIGDYRGIALGYSVVNVFVIVLARRFGKVC